MGCRRGARKKKSNGARERKPSPASIRGFGLRNGVDESGRNASSVPSCRVHAANNRAAQNGWWWEQRGDDSTGLHASDGAGIGCLSARWGGGGSGKFMYGREDGTSSASRIQKLRWRVDGAEGTDLDAGSTHSGGGVLVWEKRSYSKEEKRGKKSNLTWKEKKREGSVVSRRIRYSG